MKAVILEVRKNHTVILNNRGEFARIKKSPAHHVGCEIEVYEMLQSGLSPFIRLVSAAAVVLMVLGLGYGVYSYHTPYSFVDIDINPSIELTVNRYDRVIRAEALNEDGKELLSSKNLVHSRVQDSVEKILQQAVEYGYMADEDQNAVIMSISSKDEVKSQKLLETVGETAERELSAAGIKEDTQVELVKSTLDKRDDAKKLGLSPGKLSLIETLQESEPERKVEELKDKPVKEIMKEINKNKKSEGQKGKENKANIENQEDKEDKKEKKQEKDLLKEQEKNKLKSDEKSPVETTAILKTSVNSEKKGEDAKDSREKDKKNEDKKNKDKKNEDKKNDKKKENKEREEKQKEREDDKCDKKGSVKKQGNGKDNLPSNSKAGKNPSRGNSGKNNKVGR